MRKNTQIVPNLTGEFLLRWDSKIKNHLFDVFFQRICSIFSLPIKGDSMTDCKICQCIPHDYLFTLRYCQYLISLYLFKSVTFQRIPLKRKVDCPSVTVTFFKKWNWQLFSFLCFSSTLFATQCEWKMVTGIRKWSREKSIKIFIVIWYNFWKFLKLMLF